VHTLFNVMGIGIIWPVHQVHAERIRQLVHADEPGRYAVSRAMLHRYLTRVVANLARIASTVVEPVPSLDDDMAGMDGPLDADS
jgi:hypothetical protein